MSASQTARQQSPVFSFKQQNPDCYYIGVTHSFPALSPAPATALTTPVPTALPAFNHDHAHFTPSFVLTTDRDYYRLNLEFQRQKFQQKIQQAEAELSNADLQVVDPVPNFCQICRQSYSCYSQHIQEHPHVRALAQTQGNRWILDICSALARKEKQIAKPCKGVRKTQPRGMTRVKKKDSGHQNRHCLPISPRD